MAEFLKMPKAVILPTLEKIEDPEIKKIFEEYNRVFSELVTAVYSDVSWLYERLTVEEGTWTPTLNFNGGVVGITYTTQAGLYTKIGRMAILTAYILLSSKGTSVGMAIISGLPFTCKDDNGAYSAISLNLGDTTFANAIQGIVAKNDNRLFLREISEGGVQTNLDNTNFANTSSVILSAIYFTD